MGGNAAVLAQIQALILEKSIILALTQTELAKAAELLRQLFHLVSSHKRLQKSEHSTLHMLAGRSAKGILAHSSQFPIFALVLLTSLIIFPMQICIQQELYKRPHLSEDYERTYSPFKDRLLDRRGVSFHAKQAHVISE